MSARPPRIGAWRLWSLQGSWNRQGLQWLGWMVVLAPWLRRHLPDADERGRWLEAEPTSSNTNPYVAGLLLGARMRVEEEHGTATARSVSEAMSRTLGALGDGLMWASVRPAFALAVLVLVPVGGVWAAVVAWSAFLLGQGWLRQASLAEGLRLGLLAIDRLGDARVHRLQTRWRAAGAFLAGMVCVLVVARTGSSAAAPWLGAALALAAGLVVAGRRWRPEWALLGLAVVLVTWGRLVSSLGKGEWTWP